MIPFNYYVYIDNLGNIYKLKYHEVLDFTLNSFTKID